MTESKEKGVEKTKVKFLGKSYLLEKLPIEMKIHLKLHLLVLRFWNTRNLSMAKVIVVKTLAE